MNWKKMNWKKMNSKKFRRRMFLFFPWMAFDRCNFFFFFISKELNFKSKPAIHKKKENHKDSFLSRSFLFHFFRFILFFLLFFGAWVFWRKPKKKKKREQEHEPTPSSLASMAARENLRNKGEEKRREEKDHWGTGVRKRETVQSQSIVAPRTPRIAFSPKFR